MGTLLLCIDWSAVGAIATIIGTVITLLALIAAIWIGKQNSNLIKEDKRARLSFNVINHKGAAFLEVSNSGYYAASNIAFNVDSKTASYLVKQGFSFSSNFIVNAKCNKLFMLFLLNRDSSIKGNTTEADTKEICNYFFGDNYIEIDGSYFDNYSRKTVIVKEKFRINEFLTDNAIHIEPYNEITTRLDKIMNIIKPK